MSDPVTSLLMNAAENRHRAFVVISGTESFVLKKAKTVIQSVNLDEGLCVGETSIESLPQLPANKAKSWLGRELDLVVFNAFSCFDVDAFGAISGSLRAGGLLILLTPELSSWHRYDDPEHNRLSVYPVTSEEVSGLYLQRLADLISSSDQLSLISEQMDCRWYQGSVSQAGNDVSVVSDSLCRTMDQEKAVDAVIRVAKGHRRRPLVLTADRGRGKSAALGIAAAQLLNTSLEHIAVTAPSLKSVEVLFNHAAQCLTGAETGKGIIEWCGKTIRFYAPDEIVQSQYRINADLMLVDEAAVLPVPILSQLLKQYSRIAFASTIHGYEGTGRGFAIKFRKLLDQMTPNWVALHIDQPVRWQSGDPLENFVFKALLLNASPVDDAVIANAGIDSCSFEQLDRQQLIHQPALLNELFGLLVLAHYQTSPFDLRHLLDGPNIELFALKYGDHIVGTVLVALEGNIEPELERAIWLGKRRVRGHLLPQSLSNHVGLPEAIRFKGYRILRVATHPALQNKGLGQFMLKSLVDVAEQQGLDYLGSSFGATTELMHFWKVSGFSPVRTGLMREASSGSYSVMVLKPVSEAFAALSLEAEIRMKDSLLLMLTDILQSMETELVLELLKNNSGQHKQVALTERDQQDLESFVQSDRLYESCQVAIKKQLLLSLSDRNTNDDSLKPLVAKVLQNHSWEKLARNYQLTGRKQCIQRLKQCLSELINF